MNMRNLNRTYYITYEGVRTKNSFRSILIKSKNLYELTDVLYYAYCMPKFSNYIFRIWAGNWRNSAELSEDYLSAGQQIQEFVADAEATFSKRGE